MKSGWITKKLGEVCESISTRGCQIQQNEICDIGKFPVVSQSEAFIEGYTDFESAIENIPVVLFGDHTCCVKYIDFPFVVGADGTKLLTAKQFEVKFLYYAILKISFSLVDGKYRRHFKDLKKCQITIPPLSEQKRIVVKIDAAFKKIDALKANAEKNLANAKELFQSALDEAMRPKAGWVEKRLGEVCGITSDMVDPTLLQFTNMLHVGGGNIVSDTGELIDLKSAKEEKLKSGKYTFNKSMVLYNKIRPYLRKVARPNFAGLCSADMYPLLPNDSITRDFLYYILLTTPFTSYAVGESARAGMPKINRDELFAYRVKIPGTHDEQNAITEDLDGIRKSLKTLQQNYARQIADCAEMRQAILREAFEGRL
ncbi:MAG: restriction endonuclease subunit S [Kiritimatiellae bacterium]|nr:restriction endonuclease subunit S [Kiritimatiellia bacterium]